MPFYALVDFTPVGYYAPRTVVAVVCVDLRVLRLFALITPAFAVTLRYVCALVVCGYYRPTDLLPHVTRLFGYTPVTVVTRSRYTRYVAFTRWLVTRVVAVTRTVYVGCCTQLIFGPHVWFAARLFCVLRTPRC